MAAVRATKVSDLVENKVYLIKARIRSGERYATLTPCIVKFPITIRKDYHGYDIIDVQILSTSTTKMGGTVYIKSNTEGDKFAVGLIPMTNSWVRQKQKLITKELEAAQAAQNDLDLAIKW